MEVNLQERVKTNRPSQVQVIFFHRIRHAGPLQPLLSAYTKDRGELLTGGGEAGPGPAAGLQTPAAKCEG